MNPNTGEDYPIELQNQDNQDLYKANLVAISALEKQIGEKKLTGEYEDEPLCPYCLQEISGYNVGVIKYCPDCGQKLDWR